MTSEDQRHLLSIFSADVLSAFADVIRRFGLEVESSEIAPPDMWITFKGRRGVELTVDFEWGGLVSFIISKTSWSGSRERHNIGPVIAARSAKVSALYHSPFTNFDRDRVLTILKAAATELSEFASDVLAGDFSAFQKRA